MDIYVIDGTYELFRYFYAVPPAKDTSGQEIGAVRGVLGSVLSLIEGGATHVGVATDHVIESFRNDLYSGYKTSEGVDPALLSQFPILEEALQSMGVLVWPMIEFEADDALASAAAKAAKDDRVRQVIICTPAFQDGDPRLQQLFSRNILTWKTFRRIGVTGIRCYGEHALLPNPFSLHGKMRYCFALLRNFESMFPCSARLTICSGEVLLRISNRPVSA